MSSKVVITGASRGIGRAVALRFASAGFDLALCSRNEQNLKKLSEELVQAHGGSKIHIYPADLSIKDQVSAFADFVQNIWKTPDVLINNAGVYLSGMIHSEQDMQLEKLMNTNLYSAYYLSRALIKPMMEAKSGHIINICSTASIETYPDSASYGMSKAAMLSFSRSLRKEMIPYGIRVTAILPGATLTDSWAGSKHPEERFMSAEDIATAVYDVYELSDRTVVEEIILRPQKGDL